MVMGEHPVCRVHLHTYRRNVTRPRVPFTNVVYEQKILRNLSFLLKLGTQINEFVMNTSHMECFGLQPLPDIKLAIILIMVAWLSIYEPFYLKEEYSSGLLNLVKRAPDHCHWSHFFCETRNLDAQFE